MLNQSSGINSKRMSIADHTLGSDIEHLLAKVNINSAFLNLAKNDSDLVNDMKSSIVQLWNQARRREVLYVAIEHNVKYLTAICQASDHAKGLALNEVQQLKVQFAKQKVELDELTRSNKVLAKDSEQLALERKRITELTLESTRANDRADQAEGQAKDALKERDRAKKQHKELKD